MSDKIVDIEVKPKAGRTIESAIYRDVLEKSTMLSLAGCWPT